MANQRYILEEFVAELGGGLNFNRCKFLTPMEAIDRRAVAPLILVRRDPVS